ncbi:MAG: hypothetical protein V3V50_01255 [Gammaproteobacteria bacterium]
MPEKVILKVLTPLVIFMLAGMLAGCAPITIDRGSERPIPIHLRVDDAAYWLVEWYRAVQLPAEQYKVALEAREADFSSRPATRSRLRLALLLAEGKTSGLDRPRAQKLLKDLEADASGSAKALAMLLENRLSKRLTVKKPKKSKRSTESKKQDESMELKSARLRIKELEQQLHELTIIEQNIQDRTKQ